jgi:hypothetical protein
VAGINAKNCRGEPIWACSQVPDSQASVGFMIWRCINNFMIAFKVCNCYTSILTLIQEEIRRAINSDKSYNHSLQRNCSSHLLF